MPSITNTSSHRMGWSIEREGVCRSIDFASCLFSSMPCYSECSDESGEQVDPNQHVEVTVVGYGGDDTGTVFDFTADDPNVVHAF